MCAFWELNRQIDDANKDPGDGWRSAAQRAAQQLRGCGAAINHSPAAAQACAPALAPRGEAGEMTLEERKVAALEVIAEAARLWTVSGLTCNNISVAKSMRSSSTSRTRKTALKRRKRIER